MHTNGSMTDDEAEAVQECIERSLDSKDGRGLDVGNPAHLPLLMDSVPSGFAGIAEDDLRTVVTMCWLGPQSAGIPPAAMRHNLLDLLRCGVPDEQARLQRVM